MATRSNPVLDGPGHPLTLAAGATILVNDYVLRERWPGWWTGKLSDLGWLVVVPVLLAWSAARLGRERGVRLASLGVAGGLYTALQVWPALGGWLAPGHVADLGDLVALPALFGALLVWRRGRRPRVRLARWAAPPLAAVLIAETQTEVLPTSAPCGAAMSWPPDEPLRLWLTGAGAVPVDTDAFLDGIWLSEQGSSRRLAIVAARTSDGVAICAREGLDPNTDYTWVVGPWAGYPSNEVPFSDEALPGVHFHTTVGAGAPATDPDDCLALVSALPDEVARACPRPGEARSERDPTDSGADSGSPPEDSGADTADTSARR